MLSLRQSRRCDQHRLVLKYSTKERMLIITAVCPAVLADPPPLAPRTFEPLPLGAIAPQGWLLDQLVRQGSSLSGYLSSTRSLGGYHGDSDVVNKTKWLGGTGGGPGYIASNDQWFPYWANGNVPLVGLLRASGALGRLPDDLPLAQVIDSGMHYVLATAMPQEGFHCIAGALSTGGDLEQRNLTVAEAEAHCAQTEECAGFTYHGAANASGVVQVYFKTQQNANTDGSWTSYLKRLGWINGHYLSEGGTQIVQALTQWAEDRSAADQKAVAKVVLAHLVAVAAALSPAAVQSWAATRWASVNTLWDYALDVSLEIAWRFDPPPSPLTQSWTRGRTRTRGRTPADGGRDGQTDARIITPPGRVIRLSDRAEIRPSTTYPYPLESGPWQRLLPAFGDDPDVAPHGKQTTEKLLLEGAHRMGRLGFDYAAYYGGHPNPRSANKSFPNGSVAVWNVFDHGVNNAEGAPPPDPLPTRSAPLDPLHLLHGLPLVVNVVTTVTAVTCSTASRAHFRCAALAGRSLPSEPLDGRRDGGDGTAHLAARPLAGTSDGRLLCGRGGSSRSSCSYSYRYVVVPLHGHSTMAYRHEVDRAVRAS